MKLTPLKTELEIAQCNQTLALVSIRRLLALRHKDPMVRYEIRRWIAICRDARSVLKYAWCKAWIEKNVSWDMRADYVHR